MRVKRRRRTSLFELYFRDNFKVICIGFFLSAALCCGLGLLVLPEKWWAFPVGGVLAFLVLELLHYIQRFNS